MRTKILAISIMLSGCSAPQNESTTTAAPVVRNETSQTAAQIIDVQPSEATRNPACSWTVKDGQALNDSFQSDEEHMLVDVDVDGMGRLDVIANLRTCGNHGDCMFVALLACEGEGYQAIWGPEYAQNLTVVKAHPKRPVLGYASRTGAPGCDVPLFTPITLGYGAKWQAGVTCTDGTGVWEESCGTRHPLCETAP